MNLTTQYTRVAINKPLLDDARRLKKELNTLSLIDLMLSKKYPQLRRKVLSLLPPGSRYLSAGTDSIVFEESTGKFVYKLTRIDQEEKAYTHSPNHLKPISIDPLPVDFGDFRREFWWMKYPRARTQEDNLTPEEKRKLEVFKKQGEGKYADWDMRQLGIHEGNPVIIDQGSIELGKPQKKPGFFQRLWGG